ncbi:MAG TPA: YdeI/OmpD-associated family protein [Candidatus Dormibacteraeota bacterium]|nr:YdeI/OmpD-associated family protein [Candidatus Dormibacteraeota bacterium]
MAKFTGKLTPTARGGGGTLVPVPATVAKELGLKGMPKIKAVIAGIPYRGSLMPMGDGTYCLGVLKSIQEKAGVGAGDAITIELELDTEPRTVTVPPDLQRALARDRKAAAAWEALSHTNREEIARSLEESKKPETRERRLRAALERLAAG